MKTVTSIHYLLESQDTYPPHVKVSNNWYYVIIGEEHLDRKQAEELLSLLPALLAEMKD